MGYFFSKTIKDGDFDAVIGAVGDALSKKGFGILTDIDVQATFKKKLDIEFRNYRILGACNPGFAHRAMQTEKNIGVLLPCNIVVQQHENGDIEIAAVDPIASMAAVENPALEPLAGEVRDSLVEALKDLEA